MTQRELADALKVTLSVTTLVDGLEKTGFVEQHDHPNDRRAVLLQFRPAGEKIAYRLKSETQEFPTALFKELTASKLEISSRPWS